MPPEALDDALRTMEERAQGLATLVQRFEGAVEAGLTEWADVASIGREIAGIDPRIDVRVPAEPVMTTLNRTAGLQILRELVDNALAFSAPEERVEVEVVSGEGTVEVRVHDHGPGVDPTAVDRIFQPLEQAEELHTRTHQGAGLGLSLARMSARAMDGDVVLGSTSRSGSTFVWTSRVPGPGAASRPLREPPHVDALQHPDRDEVREHRRATVGQEGQREPVIGMIRSPSRC